MADIIITNGIVVTMDPQRRVIENGAVAIEKDRIVAVGTTEEILAAHQARYDHRRQAARSSCPGLIDGHAHAGHGLIKTMGGGNGEQWYEACHAGLHGCVDAGVLARRGPARGARAPALRRDDGRLAAGRRRHDPAHRRTDLRRRPLRRRARSRHPLRRRHRPDPPAASAHLCALRRRKGGRTPGDPSKSSSKPAGPSSTPGTARMAGASTSR